MSRHRTLRLLLVVALSVALVAAGCGGGGDEGAGDPPAGAGQEDGGGRSLPACPVDALEGADGTVEVVAWHTQQARPLDVLTELVEEYNASQSAVEVRLESQGASYEEIQRKFNDAVASEQLPSLIMVDDTFTASMADSGVVLPAQACFDEDRFDLDALVDTARSYYTLDGVLWPASAGVGNALLYYNREHFRRAGLDPEQPPATLAEVRAAAETIKAAGVAETPLVHELSTWKTEFWLTGAGSSVVDNRNGRGAGETATATLEGNPEATRLFEWFTSMRDDGLLRAVPATPGQIDQYLALATESASMLVDTSSAATSIEAFLGGTLDPDDLAAGAEDVDARGLDIGAGLFPGLVEGNKTQMGGAAWYLLSTPADEVQAGAWDFMRFMNSAEAQARMLVGGSYIPWLEAADDDPRAVSYYAGEGGVAGRWLRLTHDLVEQIDPDFPGPLIGPYDEFRDAVRKAQDELVFGGATPAEALAQAQQAVDAALARYNEESF